MIGRWRGNALAAAVGLAADALLGDPPDRAHPVAWFGTAMTAVEHRMWSDSRRRGALYAAVGVGAAAVTGVAVRSTAAATGVSVAGRMLGHVAMGVSSPLSAGDLDGARRQLPALVGRRASGLDAAEVARATIESVAENTVDAVVAPLCWAGLGGAPGVLAYRAVNTLDAMVGHRTQRYERFGWASARLDDIVNWLPARLTALLVVIARPLSAKEVIRVVRRDAGAHPSPNSGVAEAAFAAALGIRLGGVNRYADRAEDRVEDRGTLGDGRCAAAPDIAASVRLLRDVRLLAAVLLVLATLVPRCRRA